MSIYLVCLQTQLELESIKSGSAGGGVTSSEEAGGPSELQATLQMVSELRAQLESVREDMSEREKRHRAEVERLGVAGGGEHMDQENTSSSKTAGVVWPLSILLRVK